MVLGSVFFNFPPHLIVVLVEIPGHIEKAKVEEVKWTEQALS